MQLMTKKQALPEVKQVNYSRENTTTCQTRLIQSQDYCLRAKKTEHKLRWIRLEQTDPLCFLVIVVFFPTMFPFLNFPGFVMFFMPFTQNISFSIPGSLRLISFHLLASHTNFWNNYDRPVLTFEVWFKLYIRFTCSVQLLQRLSSSVDTNWPHNKQLINKERLV